MQTFKIKDNNKTARNSFEKHTEEQFDYKWIFDAGRGNILHNDRNECTIQFVRVLCWQSLAIAAGFVAHLVETNWLMVVVQL